jgi:alpha-1,3-glucosyltransferase
MPVVEDAVVDTTAVPAHDDETQQQQLRYRNIIMTELFVLAGGGTQPFWRNTTTVGTTTTTSRIGTDTKEEEEVDHPDTTTTTNNTTTKSTRPWQVVRILVYGWMISVSTKVLLFPAYRSTDFDVHRHWKALTYYYRNNDENDAPCTNIPMVHWYANNTWIPTTTSRTTTTRSNSSPPATSVQTVHTLDYPPGFALMEYIMVNHWIVHRWLFRDCHRRRRRSGSLSSSSLSSIPPPDPCFDIMDDPTTTTGTMNQNKDDRSITPKCQSYMRSTVLVVADTLYWCGAALVVAAAAAAGKHDHRDSDPPRFSPPPPPQLVMVGVSSSSSLLLLLLLLFISLTFHPTLLWLDHVHFQYNGAMLGVLLLSVGWLLHGNNHHHHSIAKKKKASFQYYEHVYHILAVVAFGLLLTLKHLYITNSLWYILYVLRRYCMTTPTLPNDQLHSPPPRTTTRRLRLQWIRLSLVAICGSMAVAVPFIPFLIAIYYSDTRALSNATDATYLQKVQEWLTQLQHRLFPFQRGLVHTYWAGNVWAIYVAAYKVMTYLGRTMGIVRRIMGGEPWLPSPDTITPTVSAVAMLLAQTPGLYMAWWAAVHKCNIRLLQSFTIVSLGTFLFQYHAHEKAIVTSLLPCIVWYAMIRYQNEPTEKIREAGSIMFDMNAYSILGLYPLLYQSQELLLKVSSTTLYLSFLWLWCYSHCDSNSHSNIPKSPSVAKRSMPSTNWLTLLIVSTTIIQLEIPYRWFWGKYEFMPLALTSLVCAFGYISLFVRLICF